MIGALVVAALAIAQVDGGPPPQPSALDEGQRLLFDDADSATAYRAALAAFDRALVEPGADAARRGLVQGRRAEAFLRLGDVTDDKNQKLRAYEQGRAAAEAGIAIAPRCTQCWFWRGATIGRFAQIKGVMQSLMLVGDVKKSFEKVLEIDPNDLDAQLSLGKMDEALPGIAGGSTERARKRFEDVVKKNPRFTRAVLDLAELLAREGEDAAAATLAQRVLAERRPLFPGEHRKFDVPRARKLLAELAR
jgi:tetratricopeptide (TPR) repeat protein